MVLEAAGAVLFAGVVEGRLVRGAGLLAVFNDVRLGLEVADLVVSFAAVALVVVRVVVVGFSPPVLLGDVSVRFVVVFEGDALAASPLVSFAFADSFGVSLGAGF